MAAKEHFTSRWGLILSVIGIAVGTGNIWRFPRIAAANGGGSFLIPWVIFLFLWSLPLIIAEFALGKKARMGPIGAFTTLCGRRYAWMGAFVAFVATAIMFYYSVVTGWCIRYLSLTLSGRLFEISDHTADWHLFLDSPFYPLFFHFLAITAGVLVIRRGVVHGIEKANRILIPGLLVLILISAIRAVTLPGAMEGLAFLFTPRVDVLLDYRVWLQALTQNAWDTGAGWGLILTYAVYMRSREDIPLNAALIGLGNNSVSLLAAITIFCTVFAIIPEQASEVITASGPANTGLTFIWIPQLFQAMPGGIFFAAFFFLALTFAALSSMISMLELTTRSLMDMKLNRRTALAVVYGVGLLCGIPAALSNEFFLNQDWVWGIALMISGLLVAIAVVLYGTERFRRNLINLEGSDLRVGRGYGIMIKYLIPAQVVILVSWWFWQVIESNPGWWNPLGTETVGTCLAQWGLVLIAFGWLNRRLANRVMER